MKLFLTKKKSSTRFTRHTILEEDLLIRRKQGMIPRGEFPRRVISGEQIFELDTCHILSPINGIARSTESGISITQDGLLKSRSEKEIREYSYSGIMEKLVTGSIVSLDFNCNPLSALFAEAKTKQWDIIFSPFSRSGNIDYAELIRAGLWTEFLQFKTNILTVFKDAVFTDFIGPGNMKYKYPEDNPEYFISRYADPGMKKDSILFLGAETIYHLLKALYWNVPFYQRYVSVITVDKNGNTNRLNEAFQVFNGQSLNYIKSRIAGKYKYFTWNSIYDDNEVVESGQQFYIDIFTHHTFIFFEEKQKLRNICLDCDRCNFLCPTGADPYFLIGEPEKFKKELCIECSICTVHCPGGIDMRKKIRELV